MIQNINGRILDTVGINWSDILQTFQKYKKPWFENHFCGETKPFL